MKNIQESQLKRVKPSWSPEARSQIRNLNLSFEFNLTREKRAQLERRLTGAN